VDLARLHYMANQIARNLASQGEAAAAEQTAQHIRAFWDPRMQRQLRDGPSAGLLPAVVRALDLIDPGPG